MVLMCVFCVGKRGIREINFKKLGMSSALTYPTYIETTWPGIHLPQYKHRTALVLATLSIATLSASAQSLNMWRGNEIRANWNDAYKWNLKHIPSPDESVHFRQQNSVISLNSSIELDNGMHLYGQELLFDGNGNINLRSPIPHRRTVNIPASTTGYANLTLTDSLSLNARIALAAKAF